MTEYQLGNFTFTLFSKPSDFIQVFDGSSLNVMPKTEARALYLSLLKDGHKLATPITYQGMGNVLLGKHW
jgi:hypothetical protein